MNGDTPINAYEPTFTQREAAELSGVDNATINNWILRGFIKLTEVKDRRLAGRRLFAIADVAALEGMNYCVKCLDMRPEGAAFAGSLIASSFYDAHAESSPDYSVWHIIRKGVADVSEDPDTWVQQGVWQDRKTGAFYHYNPVLFGTDDPFGFPHFPCLSIPTSQIAHRVFLKCADLLMQDEGHAPGTATEGLPE